MRHFILLLIISLAGYFAWYYAAKRDKRRLKRLGMRHVVAVVTIIVAALAMLVSMFYNRAINIL